MNARLFEADDLEDLYKIEEVCFKPPMRFSRRLIRALAFSSRCRTWVGLANGAYAGFAVLSIEVEENAAAGYIWTIEVLPEYRCRGIGGTLLEHCEQSAREAQCAAIELHVSVRNGNAVALYERAGYRCVGIEPAYYGSNENGLLFRKTL